MSTAVITQQPEAPPGLELLKEDSPNRQDEQTLPRRQQPLPAFYRIIKRSRERISYVGNQQWFSEAI